MERGRRNKLIGIGAAVILVLVVWAWATRGNNVETVKVRLGDITQTVEDVGFVRAVEESGLYATQSASVARLDFEVGQAVKRGQAVVILENLELKVQVSETDSSLTQAEATSSSLASSLRVAELGLKNAQDSLERTKVLYDSGAVAPTDYEKALLEVKVPGPGGGTGVTAGGSFRSDEGLRENPLPPGVRENELVMKESGRWGDPEPSR